MATIYQKTVDDKCIILGSGEALIRPMNLPVGWSHLRLAVAVSATTAGSDNTNPTAETIPYANLRSCFLWGLKDNSDIAPGDTGATFVGYSSRYWSTTGVQIGATGNYFSIASGSGGQHWQSLSTKGGTSTSADTYLSNFIGLCASTSTTPNCSSATNYAIGWALDLTLSGSNITTKFETTSLSGVTTPTATFLDQILTGSAISNSSAATAISLASGTTVADMTCFYVRHPAILNRLRIHSYGYKVIA